MAQSNIRKKKYISCVDQLFYCVLFCFSYTFQKIQENTHQVWCSQRYRAIKEYHSGAPLPPPLNVVFYTVVWVKCIFQCRNDKESNNPFRAYKLKCLTLISIQLKSHPKHVRHEITYACICIETVSVTF